MSDLNGSQIGFLIGIMKKDTCPQYIERKVNKYMHDFGLSTLKVSSLSDFKANKPFAYDELTDSLCSSGDENIKAILFGADHYITTDPKKIEDMRYPIIITVKAKSMPELQKFMKHIEDHYPLFNGNCVKSAYDFKLKKAVPLEQYVKRTNVTINPEFDVDQKAYVVNATA